MNNAAEARQQGVNTDAILDQEGTSSKEISEQDIQDAVAQARNACQTTGEYSSECAVAWDIVEEMQATRAHREGKSRKKTAFEQYCEDRPSADECRVYDV